MSFRHSVVGVVVVLLFRRWIAPQVDQKSGKMHPKLIQNLPKFFKNWSKIHPKSQNWSKIHAKSIKNIILCDFGGRGAQGRRKDKNPGEKDYSFFAFLAENGRPRGDFGSHFGAKIGPKSMQKSIPKSMPKKCRKMMSN